MIPLKDDVPSRSLLSRITDHYLQILANQAPIGFEAEFVKQRGRNVLYRGILLPFSSDDDTIDFIYGVINWKELADQHTTDELLLASLFAAAPLLLQLYATESSMDIKEAVIDGLFVQGNARALIDLSKKETNKALKREMLQKLSVMNNKEAVDYMLEILNEE